LAVGAGAVYYWWKHQHEMEHYGVEEAQVHLDKTGRHPLDTIEE
jgi:hypothetical protein